MLLRVAVTEMMTSRTIHCNTQQQRREEILGARVMDEQKKN